MAVIAPLELPRRQLTDALADRGAVADDVEAIDAPIAVLHRLDAKGLEFDHVIVVEPARLVAPDAAGLRLLYVVLTRATRQLVVVHSEPLPEALGLVASYAWADMTCSMTITEADRTAADVAWDIEPLVDGAAEAGRRRAARRSRHEGP